LASIAIPRGVTTIPSGLFYDCSRLSSVVISDSVTSIMNGAFHYCASLTNVTLPINLGSIGDGAFDSCVSLPNITIPDSTTNIGYDVFGFCTKLTNVTIPASVSSIGSMPFWSCTSLTAITVDASNSFYSSLDGVLLDKSQSTLLQYPAGKVGDYTVPWSVINIGSAFATCSGLSSVTITGSVASVASSAFENCTGLLYVTMGTNVTSIDFSAFVGCSSLLAITVDPLNLAYTSVDGVLFDKSVSILIQYPTAKAGNYVIPNSVTNLGNYAFSGCSRLTSLTIPDGVTSIVNVWFDNCGSLTNVTLPNSISGIGAFAFIDDYSLTRVTIPATVMSIGDSAFFNCVSLKDVCFRGLAPGVGMYVFGNDNNATVYYLPWTEGWGPRFADPFGCPTAVWRPQIQSNDTTFGVQSNQFGFNITWGNGMTIVVEASTDLGNPTWYPVSTNTLINRSCYFSDPQWTNYPTRSYRIRSP
jgi:hypothetical protein